MTEPTEERRAISGVALRWSHLVITLVVYMLTVGVIYGTMRTQIDELRAAQVTNPQFQEFKEDIERRLTRMERDLDDIKRAALKKEIEDIKQ